MEFQDRDLECIDCHQSFTFTAGEQEFYDRKGFKEIPKRCKPCRESRKAKRDRPMEHAAAGGEPNGSYRRESNGNSHGGGGGYGGGQRGGGGQPREMFDAVCAACGAPARVPFRPASGRPVYCRDCFANRASGNG